MDLEVFPAAIGDKSVVRQLIELSEYDLSKVSPELDVDAAAPETMCTASASQAAVA